MENTWTAREQLALIYVVLYLKSREDGTPYSDSLKGEYVNGITIRFGLSRREAEGLFETALLYIIFSASAEHLLEATIEDFNQSLIRGRKIEILNTLAELATADKKVSEGEVLYIQGLARSWGVSEMVR